MVCTTLTTVRMVECRVDTCDDNNIKSELGRESGRFHMLCTTLHFFSLLRRFFVGCAHHCYICRRPYEFLRRDFAPDEIMHKLFY